MKHLKPNDLQKKINESSIDFEFSLPYFLFLYPKKIFSPVLKLALKAIQISSTSKYFLIKIDMSFFTSKKKIKIYLRSVCMCWKKMSDIAKNLEVSKDVIKYHKKFIDKNEIMYENGQVLISDNGVDLIKKRLKKSKYNDSFEKYTRLKLKSIEDELKLIGESITHTQTDLGLLEQIRQELNEDFLSWYCQKEDIIVWADWRWKFVRLNDLLDFLKQK